MKRTILFMLLATALAATALLAQGGASAPDAPVSSLRINTRAVLLDVVVTDRNGSPVTGLKQDAFTVTEQGKPQSLTYFEEHKGEEKAAPVELPTLPLNVFSNFSPFGMPPAVNVLLLDSLNTQMSNQSFVHQQALKFLRTAKPGSRMAIFAMGLGLHFIQGFTDDPSLLVAALDNKNNNEVESPVMIKGQEESSSQGVLVGMMSQDMGNGATAAPAEMVSALRSFLQENDDSQQTDRALLTLANLQRLATYLNSFPGRKNLIWFSESIPFLTSSQINPQLEKEYDKTMNMFSAARIAVYPVSATGVSTYHGYEAANNPSPAISSSAQAVGLGGIGATAVMSENSSRDSLQEGMKRFAHDSGGKAFLNTNDLKQVIAGIAADSADFYTVSYTPTNAKLDGSYRKLEVKVAGGQYNLAYRRGYFAMDADLPGSSLAMRDQAVRKLTERNPGAVDPLLPFMDLGMPQTEQILYMAQIKPAPVAPEPAADNRVSTKGPQSRYSIDFSVTLKDLELKLTEDGLHSGKLNLSLIVYDRYGTIVTRKDHVVELNIKPDIYTIFGKTGVKLHDSIEVPKGQYWLRTGIYDQASRKVGTMEVPLSQVKADIASAPPVPAAIHHGAEAQTK